MQLPIYMTSKCNASSYICLALCTSIQVPKNLSNTHTSSLGATDGWELQAITGNYWKIITFPKKFGGMCSKTGELAHFLVSAVCFCPLFIFWQSFFTPKRFQVAHGLAQNQNQTSVGISPKTGKFGATEFLLNYFSSTMSLPLLCLINPLWRGKMQPRSSFISPFGTCSQPRHIFALSEKRV